MPATPQPENSTLARLLTIAGVADALGVDVRHVRRLVHEKRIPYIKWGHLLRFDPADIAAWVDTSVGIRSSGAVDRRRNAGQRSARAIRLRRSTGAPVPIVSYAIIEIGVQELGTATVRRSKARAPRLEGRRHDRRRQFT